jgi:hypothetical protein
MMTFPIYEKIKFMFQTSNQDFVRCLIPIFVAIQIHLTWRRRGQVWENGETTLELDGIRYLPCFGCAMLSDNRCRLVTQQLFSATRIRAYDRLKTLKLKKG